MSKKIRRIIVFLLILASVAMLSLGINVKATTPTITETTDPNDGYDTIESGSIIIGVSKFTPDTVVTGVRAAIAGSNDMLVYASKNGSTENYSSPKMYYYIWGEWYEYDEAGNMKIVEEGIKSLDIYFVNNVQKEGIQIPTAPEEKAEYTVFFLNGQTEVAQKKVLEGETIAELPTVADTETSICVGWKDLAGNEFTSSTPVTGDTVLFPVWEEKQKVELSLTANGTTTTEEYYVGQEITEVATKYGYTFEGWFAEDGTEYETPFDMPETDLALTAKWSKTVSNVDEFKSGIANATETTTITLGDNITGISETLTINKDIVLEGNGKTLSFNAISKDASGVATALVINKDNVVVNDLTVEMTAQDGWQGNYAIQVYNAEGVVLNNITASNGDAGLIVNASKVELTGTTTLLNNEFGGIEVSKGTAEGLENSELTVTGTISMNNEYLTVPTIWIEKDQGTVVGEGVADYYVTTETNNKNQTFYYSSEEIATVADVNNLEELNKALSISTVNTINLNASIENIPSRIVIAKDITLNGNGHTLSFVGTTSYATNEKQGIALIKTQDAVLKDIVITLDAKQQVQTWDGVYGVQVYDGAATLENVKVSGADGAIMSNASTVTLKGTIDVSNNDFGGIEVSLGTNVQNTKSTLVLAEGAKLVNTTEAYKLPTVWFDSTETYLEDNSDEIVLTETTIEKDGGKTQKQFYILAANATDKKTEMTNTIPGTLSVVETPTQPTAQEILSSSNASATLTSEKEYTGVRFRIENVQKPEGATVKVWAPDTSGNVYDILEAGWGPETGFTVTESYSATTPLIIQGDTAGTYSADLVLYEVATGAKVQQTTITFVIE